MIAPIDVVLVDPSLFTAPYDAALNQGLVTAQVRTMWFTRPTRRGDRQELPIGSTHPFFYRATDEAAWIPAPLRTVVKGIAHVGGLLRMLREVSRLKPAVVHVQWVVVPPLDVLAMAILRRRVPLVLTVHDTIQFNGQKLPILQRLGSDLPLKLAHRLIVHTESGRASLIERGIDPAKISVIQHGPLKLFAELPPASTAARNPRWVVLLFGEIKAYKGLDVLIEAVGKLTAATRQNLRVIVAGRPQMDLTPCLARINELGLADVFDLRLRRLTEKEMAGAFAETDAFVFPYRQVDASGVYFLVKSLGKWLIATRVGIFAEDMVDGVDGTLIPSVDVDALANALQRGVDDRPTRKPIAIEECWGEIGRSTRDLYQQVIAEFGADPSEAGE